MTWLLTQMWVLLGAAALIALVFGWGLHGALLRGRVRRADVEAGLARTELEQARTEIEGLYAAQRKFGDGSATDTRSEIDQRDRQIEALTAQIGTLKARLESAVSESLETDDSTSTAMTGAAGAAVGAVAANAIDDAAAQQQIDEAQARIEALEAEGAALREQIATFQESASGETVPTAEGQDSVQMDKLVWQNEYLRTRLKVFEEKAGVQLSGPPPEGPEDVVQAAEPVVSPAASVTQIEDRETPDEELARLRWRNRYLEGRLAYLEEERSREVEATPVDADAPVAEAGDASSEGADAAAVEGDAPRADTAMNMLVAEGPSSPDAAPEPQTALEDSPPEPEPQLNVSAHLEAQPEPEPDPQEASVSEVEPEPVATVSEEATDQNASADAPAGEAERPVAIDEPAGPDGRDDLTKIEGIGPRIQDVLNSVGVYTFQQIASWTPANETWVDDYLNVSGRVRQQSWVNQALELASGAPAEG